MPNGIASFLTIILSLAKTLTSISAMSFLVEPSGDQQISPRSLAYISEATRGELYDLILRRFMESGLSKATLARRLGKDPAQLTRVLGAPGNWTIDTCAELLFGIDGSMLTFGQCWPLQERRNNRSGAANVDLEAKAPQASTANPTRVVNFNMAFADGSNV